MKSVLYFQYPWRQWRTRLAGIYRYAAKAGWHVEIAEHGLTATSVAATLGFWKPDGCIVERSAMELPGFRAADFRDLPVVYCDPNRRRLRRPLLSVEHDSAETAALAARELVSLGLENFAFVGNVIPREWSERRREVFEETIKKAYRGGYGFDSFEPRNPDSVTAFFAELRPWLRALPRPCGIMAANDISGDLVLRALRIERLRVPEDVAVIGVDNDELVCEHSMPTLTSVVPDFEMSGFIAAQLLDDAMRGRVTAPCTRMFGAKDVVRRGSTRKFRRRDDAVRHAIDLIREKACDGLAPADVCREIGGSRRQAEMRFRELAGRSIGEEIRNARIARAKSLLLKRTYNIDSIHFRCGYGDAASLRRAFKNATGLSPRAWLASRDAQAAR